MVGIGNEEKHEDEIDQYGHVLESGKKEENENSDDLAKEINDEIVTSNESESSNTVTGKWFVVVHYLMWHYLIWKQNVNVFLAKWR